MKQIAGLTITICGIITAATITAICMLWWTTADIIHNTTRR